MQTWGASAQTPVAFPLDLDGPLLLAGDRAPKLRYDGARLHPPEPSLWG